MRPDLRPSADEEGRQRKADGGGAGEVDRLTASLHVELRRAAARLLRRQRPDHTLQPTALVNEAWLKLFVGGVPGAVASREHLYRAAVKAMRQVLTDHHRRRNRSKRSGRWRRHPIDAAVDRLNEHSQLAVEALDEALDRLAGVDSRACLVTTFHGLLGMSLNDVSKTLEISPATAERDWQFARGWLRMQLGEDFAEP
jgi:RNA polymerase sigma factor (TIGR02999 family)